MPFKLKIQKIALTTAFLLSSSVVLAIPFSSFETRSMAMGGAGVAVGTPGTAPLFNPALLSMGKKTDDFAIMAAAGIRVADPENLREGIAAVKDSNLKDTLQASMTTFTTSITAAKAAPTSATLAAVAASATAVTKNITDFSAQLGSLSNKPIVLGAGAATVVALPSQNVGVAFYANATVAAGGKFVYKDAQFFTTIADATSCMATAAALPVTTPAEVLAAQAALNACSLPSFEVTGLQSGLNVRGVSLGEFGFSLSHDFNNSFALGITPKIIKATLFDLDINANSAKQSITPADFIAEYSVANFDLGAATNFSNGWTTGLVIKNVIPKTLAFKRATTLGVRATPVATGQTLILKPQTRLGVAHSTSWSTLALDIDLMPNDPAGLENKTQYVALGGELDAWGWAQLRAGYRVDMVNSGNNVTSVGLGFAAFGVLHTDFAVAGNKNEIGASFRMGMHF